MKISLEIDPSAYIPKSPQALEHRSARIAMNKLSRSRRPRSQRGSKASRNTELACSDRSDRLHRPVRPVGLGIQIPDRSDRLLRPVAPRQPANQSSKCQISSKRSPNPTKLGGKLCNYPVNISPKDLIQKIHGSREIEERSKRIGVFSKTQNRQFVRTHDSRGFGIRLDA